MSIGRWLAGVSVVLGVSAFAVTPPTEVAAQQAGSAATSNVPDAARALVVAVRAYRDGGSIAENGAGFVLGLSGDSVFIATALHVIEDRGERIFVTFEGARSDSVQATVAARADSVTQIDLAILRIPRSEVPEIDNVLRFLNRRGDAFGLSLGDRVSPVGCPDGSQGCWTAPSPPDQVLGQGAMVTFQTSFVNPGSSGGALFNEDWEIVGMVVTDQQPRADAIPINLIVLQAETWGVPVSLVPPSVPRIGYGLTLGGAVLLPSQRGGERIPSFRGGIAYRLSRRVSALGTALRLAPENAGSACRVDATRDVCDAIANGVLVGASVDVRVWRLAAHPFVEVGYAEVSGRWDAGGIFVDNAYEPDWVNENVTGLAWGVGATLEATLLPRLILEAVGGNWAVPDPFASVPGLTSKMPTLFYGVGLRIGL